eukprot:11942059-Karenia_brevis.AAC.1
MEEGSNGESRFSKSCTSANLSHFGGVNHIDGSCVAENDSDSRALDDDFSIRFEDEQSDAEQSDKNAKNLTSGWSDARHLKHVDAQHSNFSPEVRP